MSGIRKVFDVAQGIEEELKYGFVTTEWGTAPSVVTAVAKDLEDGSDVSAIVFPGGTIGVVGDLITLKPFKALTLGKDYRIEVKFTANSSIFELYGLVRAEL